ncbi:fumarylacetoacetate hydrolase family protein [Membranicola marinus]|uniref:Fumarylacetoacetate hydrolase family protein n=1 Tax=Membranihabitans marinus TaxID=1227546 RepID=A0A953HL81_9BACT|nr:fumarylacetoacetate hydrolase family protein [Membranihabitans marinus]MBY5957712.1 fumarylacetoacetate hydrolase family protein [Membranihabitans marinus]
MKVFCVGRNYREHARELDNPVPDEPLIFCKPVTALLLDNNDFHLPDFSNNVQYEGEIVIRISKNGKAIAPEEASNYYDKVAFGIDFTARDLQTKLKEKGHPWEIAKGFDQSAALSRFISVNTRLQDSILFETHRNGKMVQSGNTDDMIFSYEDIIVYLSKFFTLNEGDMIFTGTPAGVGKVERGDVLEGYIDGRKLLSCHIK